MVQVLVRFNNVDQALRALKKKMQREGIFGTLKRIRHYQKPSQAKAQKAAESLRRRRKFDRRKV